MPCLREPDGPVFLDHAAGSPVRVEILADHSRKAGLFFHNPHGSGKYSATCARQLVRAERRLLEILDAPTESVQAIWTSGGTEAANLAVHGVLGTHPYGRCVTDCTAHTCLRESCIAFTQRFERQLRETGVDSQGQPRLPSLSAQHSAITTLLALTHVNNETGAILDLERVRRWRNQCPAPVVFLLDALQGFGKLPFSWRRSGVDLLLVGGRKIGGPFGVGALLASRAVPLAPLMFGGGQQRGLRPGTIDVVGALEFVQSAEMACEERESARQRAAALKQRLLSGMRARGLREFDPVTLSPDTSSPYIVSVAFPGFEGAVLMRLLAERGVVVGTGSACSAESAESSRVLRAMGVPERAARGALRISFGWNSTSDDVDRLLEALESVLREY